jgi:hypothetical protein
LPALFVAQLVFKGGHGEPPAGNLPEELAIGSPAHRWRIGKIARRDGKFGGLLASAVAFLSVTAPAVLAVGLLPGADGIVSRGNRIFQPLGRRRGAPTPGGVDRRQHTRRQNYNQG